MTFLIALAHYKAYRKNWPDAPRHKVWRRSLAYARNR